MIGFIKFIIGCLFSGLFYLPGTITATYTFLNLVPVAFKYSLIVAVKSFELIFYPTWSRIANHIIEVIVEFLNSIE